MKLFRNLLILLTIVLLVLALMWLASGPDRDQNPPKPDTPQTSIPMLRLGIIPERDVFAQRKRYQALVKQLSIKLNCPVLLVTMNSYEAALRDLAENQIDGAFLGSLAGVLAQDRLKARVVVKAQYPEGLSTYRGVIIVREDSPIQDVKQLAGRSLAMVRTTYAGNLYPMYLLHQNGMLEGALSPQIRWVGTHDEVARMVLDGSIEAGAMKDLRLAAYLHEHPEGRVRQLAISPPVPENALWVRAGMSSVTEDQLRQVLLNMHQEETGRQTLKIMDIDRFVPCSPGEHHAVYEMAHAIGTRWNMVGVAGPPPHTQPAIEPP